jgi:hypothetical protein
LNPRRGLTTRGLVVGRVAARGFVVGRVALWRGRGGSDLLFHEPKAFASTVPSRNRADSNASWPCGAGSPGTRAPQLMQTETAWWPLRRSSGACTKPPAAPTDAPRHEMHSCPRRSNATLRRITDGVGRRHELRPSWLPGRDVQDGRILPSFERPRAGRCRCSRRGGTRRLGLRPARRRLLLRGRDARHAWQ